jgi:hypothetical protein
VDLGRELDQRPVRALVDRAQLGVGERGEQGVSDGGRRERVERTDQDLDGYLDPVQPRARVELVHAPGDLEHDQGVGVGEVVEVEVHPGVRRVRAERADQPCDRHGDRELERAQDLPLDGTGEHRHAEVGEGEQVDAELRAVEGVQGGGVRPGDEDEAGDEVRAGVLQLQRHLAAHGVTDGDRVGEVLGIEHGGDVAGEPFDRVVLRAQAPRAVPRVARVRRRADAAVVEDDDPVPFGERRREVGPEVVGAHEAGAQHDGRAVGRLAQHRVADPRAVVGDDLAVLQPDVATAVAGPRWTVRLGDRREMAGRGVVGRQGGGRGHRSTFVTGQADRRGSRRRSGGGGNERYALR